MPDVARDRRGVVLALQVPFLIARFTEAGAPAGPASLICGTDQPAGLQALVRV